MNLTKVLGVSEELEFVHPISGKVLDIVTKEGYIDWLLQAYVDILNAEADVTKAKTIYREKINSLIKDTKAGIVKISGLAFKANITRKMNEKYDAPEDKDALGWLQTAYTNIESIREAISIKFEAKTATMTKYLEVRKEDLDWIEKHPEDQTDNDKILLNLRRARHINPGSPEIKIERIE